MQYSVYSKAWVPYYGFGGIPGVPVFIQENMKPLAIMINIINLE
jgi:hypothetical protein